MKDTTVAAIDIALLLPDEILQLCSEINSKCSDPSKYVQFDDGIFVPHITLFQCFINISDRGQLIADLQDIICGLSNNFLDLEIDRISWKDKTQSFFYEFRQSERSYKTLKILQYWVHALMKKYMLAPGYNPDRLTFADGVATIFDLKYVAEFQSKHTKEDYWPHITLGKIAKDMNQSVNIVPFSTNRLGLFWLSAEGTCNVKHQWL